MTVGDAMSTPARTITPDRPVVEAATIMLDEDVNRLPVVDADGALVGLVSRGDLVRAFARSDDEILREIEEDVIRKVMWLNPGSIDVTVTNGVVTLAGEVASEADAELLPTFARKVPGVVEVSSSLTYRGRRARRRMSPARAGSGARRLERRSPSRANRRYSANRRYFWEDSWTYAATSAICCSLSWPLNAGIAPLPFVTRVDDERRRTACCRRARARRSRSIRPRKGYGSRRTLRSRTPPLRPRHCR